MDWDTFLQFALAEGFLLYDYEMRYITKSGLRREEEEKS